MEFILTIFLNKMRQSNRKEKCNAGAHLQPMHRAGALAYREALKLCHPVSVPVSCNQAATGFCPRSHSLITSIARLIGLIILPKHQIDFKKGSIKVLRLVVYPS